MLQPNLHMTLPFLVRGIITVACATIACSINGAIEPVPVSLRSTVAQAIGKTTVTIDYSRPNAKGRDVFGTLVPYGDVWRTGANEATTLAFTTDVTLGGNEIPAGRYALFTIPRAETWTIIVNTVADQFGAFRYDASKDLLRFDVPVRPLTDQVETFEIAFTEVANNTAKVELRWLNTVVQFPISVTEASNRRVIEAEIERDVVNGGEPTWQNYGEAARYYTRHGIDLARAVLWFDRANELHPAAYWLFYEKARVLHRLQRPGDAVKAVEVGIAAAVANQDQRGQDMGRDLLDDLARP